MTTDDDSLFSPPPKAIFDHAKNINIGSARLIWSEVRQAWAIPGCRYVSSELRAREYALAMHNLISARP